METFLFLSAKNHDREWKMNRLMCDKQLINSPFSTRVKMRGILDILVDNETRVSFDRYDIFSTIFTSSTRWDRRVMARTRVTFFLIDHFLLARPRVSDKKERKSRQRFANSVALKGGLSLTARLRYKTIYVS